MHSLLGNKLRKSALVHTIAVHDSCAIINVENDQSNISKIDLVSLPIDPVFRLSIRDSDVSAQYENTEKLLEMFLNAAVLSLSYTLFLRALSKSRTLAP